ncbi:hypothetical protein GF319_11305 [Candidatus Bathyarchaeota archaeon]|jgi:Asp-tRNA(Asn)/Glu-tRNA(Gln) amidotransferase C subunit|nr:hypothetical protein [Candidatus Bathyarchaeota archaeon]
MSVFDEADILFDLIKNKYKNRLNDEQLEKVKEKISEIIDATEKLRAIPLDNSDEPKFIFNPSREEEN